MELSVRHAKFSGQFYPETKDELVHLLQFIVKVETYKINTYLAEKTLIGAIVPHAGYIYSGYHAVHAYQLLHLSEQQFDTMLIINPNHTGKGAGHINLSSAYQWETPMGSLMQDKEFADALSLEYNDQAHNDEHSGEVQLPFLQKFITYPFKIVMITMNHQNYENAVLLAKNIHRSVQETKRKIFILASSDFSHYEHAEKGFKKDQYLIDQIMTMNTEECYQQVKKHHISACGYGPIMTLLEYAKLAFGKPKMELLRRGHSGEVNVTDKVVDYASFLCYE